MSCMRGSPALRLSCGELRHRSIHSALTSQVPHFTSLSQRPPRPGGLTLGLAGDGSGVKCLASGTLPPIVRLSLAAKGHREDSVGERTGQRVAGPGPGRPPRGKPTPPLQAVASVSCRSPVLRSLACASPRVGAALRSDRGLSLAHEFN